MYKECRHIKTNGLRCQSPALRGQPYCYFHARIYRLAKAPKPAPNEPFKLPVMEDSAAIQLALNQVVNEMGASRLDPRRAGLVLYALQIASQHIDRNFVFKSDLVRSLTVSPEGEDLAPVKHVCDDDDNCDVCPEKSACEHWAAAIAEKEAEKKNA